MSQGRRQAAATEKAVMAYMPGADVYALAKKFGISPSNLYRALKHEGYKFKRGNHK
jgi:transposase-like protein